MNEDGAGDNSNPSENGGRNPSKFWAALADLIRSYAEYNRAKAKSAENYKAQPEGTAAWLTAGGTIGAAILAFVAAVIFWCQLGAMQQANRDTGKTANAAKKSADTAYQALVGVERPVLLVTMPKQFAYDSSAVDPTRPLYVVEAKNVGKQVANFIMADASFIVQDSSVPPKLVPIGKRDESHCPIYFIADRIAGVGEGIGVTCQRHAALTTQQIAGIDNQSLFGFFRVSFLYTDPVGKTRISTFVFQQKPPISSATFIRLTSGDQILEKGTSESRAEAVRQFIGAELHNQAVSGRSRAH